MYWKPKNHPCLITSFDKYKSISAPTFNSSTLPIYQYEYQSLFLIPSVALFLGFIRSDAQDSHHIYTDASKVSSNGCVEVGVLHFQYNIVQKVKL